MQYINRAAIAAILSFIVVGCDPPFRYYAPYPTKNTQSELPSRPSIVPGLPSKASTRRRPDDSIMRPISCDCPAGPAGPQGTPGADGATGPQGATGPVGPHQLIGAQCILDYTHLQALSDGEPELTIPCIDVVPSGGHFAGVSYSRESFVPFGSMSGSHVLEAHMYSNVAGDVATLANLFDAPMVQSTKPMAEEFSGGEVFISLTSTPFISLNTYSQGHIELTIWYWP